MDAKAIEEYIASKQAQKDAPRKTRAEALRDFSDEKLKMHKPNELQKIKEPKAEPESFDDEFERMMNEVDADG